MHDYMKTTIAVIMSTYNGELYLRQQIDSILDQKDVAVKLFIRDDGSTDRTPEILQKYSTKYDNIFFDNPDSRENLGVKDSFLSLLKKVYCANQDIQYFAFADQDDVWKDDKLSAAIKMLMGNTDDAAAPQLYYSNKTFVDKDLNVIAEEHIRYYGDFFEILWPSLAFGCTMVFNRPLIEYAVKEFPGDLFLHDSWIYRLAKSIDAHVVFDPMPYVLYRQHGNNVCGMKAANIVRISSITKLFTKREHKTQRMLKNIQRVCEENIPAENKKYIDWLLTYDKKISSWLHLVICPMAVRRGFCLYMAWIARLLFHRM